MQKNSIDFTDLDGVKFGRYVPLKLLGKGAMGRVFLSLDPVLQRSVAVKVIALDALIDDKTRGSFLERFTLEARASACLSHPSIVKVFDAGEQNGYPWIAFEYVDGESLEELIIRDKQISFTQIKSILTDIASALAHAHDANIVHRDVKPANILIEKKTGIAKLSDFGVVKSPFSSGTQEGTTLGSPGYMSPEQIDGTGVDPRSDLFSLGIVFYQMLTGRHPFLRDTIQSTLYATIMGDYVSVKQIVPDISTEIDNIVTRMLKVKKEERISSATEFLESLDKINETGCESENLRLSEKIIRSGTGLVKTVQPVFDIIKRTDRLIITTAKDPRVKSALKKTSVTIWKIICVTRLNAGKIPLKKLVETKKSRIFTLTVAGVFLLFATALYIYDANFNLTKDEKTVIQELNEKGFRGNSAQLMKKCSEFIDKNELNNAQEISGAMTKIRRHSAHAYILNAIIELKDDDGDDAVEYISKGKRIKNFKKNFRKEKQAFLDALESYLTDEEADSELVDCIVYTLNIGKEKVIRTWPYEKPYWLRWNSIRILEECNIKVDMVQVYILDLNHAGSVRVRIRAANRLAGFKDKRAYNALDEVSKRGFSDPIVSVAAQSALESMKK